MTRVLLTLMLLAAFVSAARAAEPQLRVEAQLLPDSTVRLGATLTLQLDVLTDTWFTAAPVLADLPLPGTRVAAPTGSPVHLTLERDGQTFFGLRYLYRITPRQVQRFEIPSLTVSAQVGQATETLHTRSAPLAFSVLPAPDDGASLVADSLQLRQILQPPAAAYRVGDSLERRVELQTRGTPMELLPPTRFSALEGTRQYPQPVRLEALSDGRGHGEGALRVDSIVYQFERPGRFDLPPLELRWREAGSGALHVEHLPGLTLEVAALPTSATRLAWRERLGLWLERHALGGLLLIAGLALGWQWLAGLAAAALQWLRSRFMLLRRRYRESEHQAWSQLLRQLHQQPPRLDGLYRWLQRQQLRSTELQRSLRLLYGNAPDTTRGIRELRRLLPKLRRQRGEPRSRRPALRKLNP